MSCEKKEKKVRHAHNSKSKRDSDPQNVQHGQTVDYKETAKLLHVTNADKLNIERRGTSSKNNARTTVGSSAQQKSNTRNAWCKVDEAPKTGTKYTARPYYQLPTHKRKCARHSMKEYAIYTGTISRNTNNRNY